VSIHPFSNAFWERNCPSEKNMYVGIEWQAASPVVSLGLALALANI